MAGLSQRIVWTLLPNGYNPKTGRLMASVLVSPRLTLPAGSSPSNLTGFQDWKDWPGVISASQFTISVDGGPAHPASLTSKPDSKVWPALFPPETHLEPYAFTDLRGKVILNYPAATIAKTVEDLYGKLGVQADRGLPVARDLLNLVGSDRKRLGPDQVLALLRAEAKGGKAGALRDPAAAIDLLAAYHTPLEKEIKQGQAQGAVWSSRKRVDLPQAGAFRTLIDFHQIVASVIQYGELSQRLGLVVLLEIDPALVPNGDHVLTLSVTWPKKGSVQTQPDIINPVMARKQDRVFEAAPRSPASAIAGRFLKLQGGGFEVLEMDVDGAGMKLKNLATNLARPQPTAYDDESFTTNGGPSRAGAPSLRSAGLMLAQTRRDQAIQALFAKNGGLEDAVNGNQKPLPILYAEDLIRGYRVDIHDDTVKAWRSLCYRKIDFGFVNTGASDSTEKEEGMVRLAAASSADGSNPDILKIHDGLFAWKGWSLCAPEPGRALLPDETVGDPNETPPPPGLPLSTRFTVTPGSLPMLRFGRSYAMRVRLADLAGQSAPFSDSDIQPAEALSNSAVYRRYEPVEAPALALVQAAGGLETPADGESMGRLAIRTFNDVPAKNTVPIKTRARRHLVPPRVSHRFAEQHGVMDTAEGKLDRTRFGMLSTLDKPLDETTVKTPGPTPGSPSVDVTYAVGAERFTLPYLPDPLALGVAIRVEGLEGVDPSVVHPVPFYGAAFDPNAKPDWPKAQPFTVVAAEDGVGQPGFEPSRLEFVVPLRKADRARLYISSLMPSKALGLMAVSQMILDQKPPAAQVATLTKLAEEGQHWMLTPWRTIELTHAVQKPLITPHLNGLAISRGLNAVAATPNYATPLHAKSTARIDLKASWLEPLDDPNAPDSPAGPIARAHRAHVYGTPISRTDAPNDQYASPGLQHVFADTRYRRVVYALDATTRFREFMPEAIRADEDQLKVSSAESRTWVPNAAPPPPPNLLYVIPTFGWARGSAGGKTASFRVGGGLRVYLDRPWFASGFGEMLGVVLAPSPKGGATSMEAAPASLVDGPYRTLVTQWGADPIWVTGRIPSPAPPKAAFPLARWRPPIPFDGTSLPAEEGADLPAQDFPVTNLAHAGLPLGLDVAPHAVGYDSERQLWYADIVIRPPPNSYFPFVRLALARYHPVSVDGAHLSGVVMAEFQQLTPGRLAVVTRQGDRVHVAVYGAGVGEAAQGSPEAGLFHVETQVLEPTGDPDLGWRTLAPPGAEAAEAQGPAKVMPAYQSAAMLNQLAGPPSGAAQIEAQKYIDADDYQSLLNRPDLIAAIAPPVLWETDVILPAAPAGGKRRLLIVENERYETSPEAYPALPTMAGGTPLATRIVYFETIEV